jgi:mono/diheme cytochrome c family protein
MNTIRVLGYSAAAGIVALAAAGGLAAALSRQARSRSHELPPYLPPASIAAESLTVRQTHGRALYFQSCAHCHGEDATGDEGPDLHGLEISDRRIATVVKRGIKGEMPSFAKKHDNAQIAELVAYVRSLQP